MRPALVVALAALSLALAQAAQAKTHYLRFKVLSVTGEQTVIWHDSVAYGDCGTITRSGSQTIAFRSTKPARLRLLRIPRHTTSGRHHGFTYVGVNFIRAKWTFTRSSHQSPPPSCPVEPALAQASDCGAQGPFNVPIDIGWRDGKVNLRGVTDPLGPQSPRYGHCDYDGFHEVDLLYTQQRLSQKRLTSRRRRTLSVGLSQKATEPTGDAEGSQTTSLKATVTLRRVH